MVPEGIVAHRFCYICAYCLTVTHDHIFYPALAACSRSQHLLAYISGEYFEAEAGLGARLSQLSDFS